MPRTDDVAPPAAVAVGRLLQVLVYAPLGAGAKLIDDAPAALQRVRQELSNARFVGRLAVGQGEAALRERLASAGDARSGRDRVGAASEVPAAPGDDPTGSVVEEAAIGLHDSGEVPRSEEADVAASNGDVAVDPDDDSDDDTSERLAIPDYDHLPAIDIVGQLESLTADELEAIESYERANRRRRTVLGKIAQLGA